MKPLVQQHSAAPKQLLPEPHTAPRTLPQRERHIRESNGEPAIVITCDFDSPDAPEWQALTVVSGWGDVQQPSLFLRVSENSLVHEGEHPSHRR